jgi:prepilin-type N-terminal cleavage/methylation domain-containing protein
MRKSTIGFTIVELLIGIVVIAVLATISIVAYNGIQNRANDTAVQSELTNMAKKIQLSAADTGELPAGGGTSISAGVQSPSGQQNFPGFTFHPSKTAYMTGTTQNLVYCTGTETASGKKIFRIRARSKSGNTFEYSSNGGVNNAGNVGIGNHDTVCSGMNYPRTFSYGYYDRNNTWWPWTN